MQMLVLTSCFSYTATPGCHHDMSLLKIAWGVNRQDIAIEGYYSNSNTWIEYPAPAVFETQEITVTPPAQQIN